VTTTTIWYLSFSLPGRFLGGIVIEAEDFTDALAETYRLRINPGGEVMGFRVPEAHHAEALTMAGRLMPHDELEARGLVPIPVTRGGATLQ
jgi:hypothetical protein